MIINNVIRDIVSEIDNIEELNSNGLNTTLNALVQELSQTTSNPMVKERQTEYLFRKTELARYPVEEDGFACSFDPLVDEEGFIEAWMNYGIVVGKGVLKPKTCDAVVKSIYSLVAQMSEGACDLMNPATWNQIPSDENKTSLISRGFLEIYHHDILAQIRQNVRIYIHHVVLWGRHDLWTSFDRLGIKLPYHEESKALPLHVDQNPLIHPEFTTLQGVLALSDCPIERGTFVGAPGSKTFFPEYKTFAPNRGEYVEIPESFSLYEILKANSQAIPLRKGDLITWDSRTTHANSENISNETRLVAYIACGLAKEKDQTVIDTRMEAFRTGIGSNVREALMHASKKSRYTDYLALDRVRGGVEELNLLGQLLYGEKKYSEL